MTIRTKSCPNREREQKIENDVFQKHFDFQYLNRFLVLSSSIGTLYTNTHSLLIVINLEEIRR